LRKTLEIKSRIKDYSISFEDDFKFLDELKTLNNAVWIFDRKVYDLYRSEFNEKIDKKNIFLLDALEENKCFEKLPALYDWLMRFEAKKNLTLISVGGGIVQDLTGFVASTLYRGINWIFIPTTLLAQTDSSLGSKTSLNFINFKNQIGTFYPPSRIFVYPKFLATLEPEVLYSGLGEVIKLHLMDPSRLGDVCYTQQAVRSILERLPSAGETIHNGLRIKLDYIANDEFDTGRRNLLNYGHCFGHALESVSNYYIPHGIAVNIGIMFANKLSVLRGSLAAEKEREITQLLNLPNIGMLLRREDFDAGKIVDAMKHDKKNSGAFFTVIIPDQKFQLQKVLDVTSDEVRQIILLLVEALPF